MKDIARSLRNIAAGTRSLGLDGIHTACSLGAERITELEAEVERLTKLAKGRSHLVGKPVELSRGARGVVRDIGLKEQDAEFSLLVELEGGTLETVPASHTIVIENRGGF